MPNQRTGHIDWDQWRFDYAVSDSEGLALLNVYYNQVLVLGKGSIPVVRVKYREDYEWYHFWEGCGPYADQIRWKLGGTHGLQKISNCGDQYVCLQSYTSGNIPWLEIGVYARIGKYHIYQAWYLSDTGTILPRLWSKGLSCNMDHEHHGYWRLDFDVDGRASNRVYLFDNGGLYYYPKEANDIKRPSRAWFVRNERTGHIVWIIPGQNDGQADKYSKIDVGIRLYHESEEKQPWPFGTGNLGFLDGEDVGNSDIVFWYVGHLHHVAAEGGDAWHSMGPTIQVQPSGTIIGPPPGHR